MNSEPRIAVLLSTYNGERYLDEQLASLFTQTYRNIIVVARDDGSSDRTVDILRTAAAAEPERLHLVQQDSVNMGARDSFSYLVEYALACKEFLQLDPAYLMFCDQDDIWEADKIAMEFQRMRQAEEEFGTDTPVLIHSDLLVVNQDNQLIADSLISYQNLEIHRNGFYHMVLSNLVTGCTTLFNEALARRAMPVHPGSIMHDWWLALVAVAFGHVVFIDKPLVRYRQHGGNTIGAKEFVPPNPRRLSFWRRVLSHRVNEHLMEVARQARGFRRRYRHQIDGQCKRRLLLIGLMSIRLGVLQRLLFRLARRF